MTVSVGIHLDSTTAENFNHKHPLMKKRCLADYAESLLRAVNVHSRAGGGRRAAPGLFRAHRHPPWAGVLLRLLIMTPINISLWEGDVLILLVNVVIVVVVLSTLGLIVIIIFM